MHYRGNQLQRDKERCLWKTHHNQRKPDSTPVRLPKQVMRQLHLQIQTDHQLTHEVDQSTKHRKVTQDNVTDHALTLLLKDGEKAHGTVGLIVVGLTTVTILLERDLTSYIGPLKGQAAKPTEKESPKARPRKENGRTSQTKEITTIHMKNQTRAHAQ